MSEEMISTEDKSDNDNGGAIQVGFVIGLIRRDLGDNAWDRACLQS